MKIEAIEPKSNEEFLSWNKAKQNRIIRKLNDEVKFHLKQINYSEERQGKIIPYTTENVFERIDFSERYKWQNMSIEEMFDELDLI